MGTLYIVSTPIGNLKDISVRAIEILSDVDFILAEDTRTANKVLRHYSIDKRLVSFHEYNEDIKQEEILAQILAGKDIALVSDAGTPTVSDPGYKLVRESAKNNIQIVPIPGPSSVLSALVASGLPTDSFVFLGYVPKKAGKRKDFFQKISQFLDLKVTVIFFETRHRIAKTLPELTKIYPNYQLVIARELTKVNEEIIRGKTSDVVNKLKSRNLKGEITLLLHK